MHVSDLGSWHIVRFQFMAVLIIATNIIILINNEKINRHHKLHPEIL